MEWKLIKDNIVEIQKAILPLSYRTRIPYQVIMVVGGWSERSPTNVIEVYDTQAKIWLKMRYRDLRRAYHGMCTINDKVYVVGGFDGRTHCNTLRCYDPETYIWKEKARMHYSRCYVSVAVLDDKIYAIGGYDGRHRLKSVERYDIECDKWEMIASMNFCRSDAGAVAFKGHIFVAGGFNGNEVLNSCEMYNLLTNKWTIISYMKSPRSGLGLIVCNNYLYAVGGRTNGKTRLHTVERFSIFNNKNEKYEEKWNYVKEMKCARSNFSIAVLDDNIYVIGGFNGQKTTNIVEIFDTKTNTWQTARQTNVNRSAHKACVLEGLIDMKGYSVHYEEIENSPCYLEKYRYLNKTNDDSGDGDYDLLF